MAFFITFEGTEGCGKSTQLRGLREHLESRGFAVLATREPGGCRVAEAVRAILLDPDNRSLVARAELLLYAAARAQHVEQVIRPALAAGKVVLCDRFTDATLAYQSGGRGLDAGMVADLNRMATADLVPDLTLLLDFPVEAGLERARDRNRVESLHDEERFELETPAFHQRVRDAYLALAAQERRVHLIAAEGSAREVGARVIAAVDEFLSLKGRP